MPELTNPPLQLLTVIWQPDGSEPITHTDQIHNIAEYPSPQALVTETHESTSAEYPDATVQTSLWELIDTANPSAGWQVICCEGDLPFEDGAA